MEERDLMMMSGGAQRAGRALRRASAWPGCGAATRRGVTGPVAGIAGLLAVACGTNGEGQPGARKTTEPVTVEFLHRWDGVREPLAQELVRSFEAKHAPVTVSNQMVLGSGEGFVSGMPTAKILAMVLAGTPPDVFMVGSDAAAEFAVKGALQPLDDLLRRDKIEAEKVFYPALARMAQRDRKTHGLPQVSGNDHPFVYMNAEAFQSVGLDPNRPPQSWQDLIAYSEKLTKREGTALSRIGLQLPGPPFIQWQAKNGGKLLSDDATRVLFNDQIGQDTLQFLVDATTRLYGGVEPLNEFAAAQRASGPGGEFAAWYNGKVGLRIDGVSTFFEMRNEAPKFNAGFRYTPGLWPPNTARSGASNVSLVDYVWLYSMGKGTKKADAAWELLKYATAGEGNKQFVLAQGRPSPVQRYNEDAAYQKENPHWNTLVLKALALQQPLPQTPVWPQVRTAINGMFAQVVTGKKGVKDALNEAAAEGQRLLDAAGK